MFRIKICGVTRREDAVALAEAGADAIGLNFYEKSPRSTNPTEAAELRAAAAGALAVGVFVNATAERIREQTRSIPLGAIQLHGDEPDEFLRQIDANVPVIRAIRLGPDGLAPVAERIEAARRIGRPYAAVLVDAAVPKSASGETVYGGSGQTTDWARVCEERGLLGETPLILAGGLTPDNVAEAIRATGADGVDTASGVETAPGLKDPAAIRRFVAAALDGFTAIGR